MSRIEDILQLKIKHKDKQTLNNPKSHKQLLPVFDAIINSEANNGVKNVYIKAAKAIKKERSSI